LEIHLLSAYTLRQRREKERPLQITGTNNLAGIRTNLKEWVQLCCLQRTLF